MLKLGLLLSWKGKFSDFISCFPIPLFYFVFYCNSLPGGSSFSWHLRFFLILWSMHDIITCSTTMQPHWQFWLKCISISYWIE